MNPTMGRQPTQKAEIPFDLKEGERITVKYIGPDTLQPVIFVGTVEGIYKHHFLVKGNHTTAKKWAENIRQCFTINDYRMGGIEVTR